MTANTAKKYPKQDPTAMITHRIESLICSFDVQRFQHRNCTGMMHYVVMIKSRLYIVHKNILDSINAEVMMSTVDIHGDFFSESQRETMKIRLTDYLKGVL